MNTVTLETPYNNNSVKVGQYYKNNRSGDFFIISKVDNDKYALISLIYGNRFINSVSDINEIFSDKKRDFDLIKRISRINIEIE